MKPKGKLWCKCAMRSGRCLRHVSIFKQDKFGVLLLKSSLIHYSSSTSPIFAIFMNIYIHDQINIIQKEKYFSHGGLVYNHKLGKQYKNEYKHPLSEKHPPYVCTVAPLAKISSCLI